MEKSTAQELLLSFFQEYVENRMPPYWWTILDSPEVCSSAPLCQLFGLEADETINLLVFAGIATNGKDGKTKIKLQIEASESFLQKCNITTDNKCIGHEKRIQFLQIGYHRDLPTLKQQLKNPNRYPMPNLDAMRNAQLMLTNLFTPMLNNEAELHASHDLPHHLSSPPVNKEQRSSHMPPVFLMPTGTNQMNNIKRKKTTPSSQNPSHKHRLKTADSVEVQTQMQADNKLYVSEPREEKEDADWFMNQIPIRTNLLTPTTERVAIHRDRERTSENNQPTLLAFESFTAGTSPREFCRGDGKSNKENKQPPLPAFESSTVGTSSRELKNNKSMRAILSWFPRKRKEAIKSIFRMGMAAKTTIEFLPAESCTKKMSDRTVAEFAHDIGTTLAVFSDHNADTAARILDKMLNLQSYENVKKNLLQNSLAAETDPPTHQRITTGIKKFIKCHTEPTKGGT